MQNISKLVETTTSFYCDKHDVTFSIIERLYISHYTQEDQKPSFDVVFLSESSTLNKCNFTSKDEIFTYIHELAKKNKFSV